MRRSGVAARFGTDNQITVVMLALGIDLILASRYLKSFHLLGMILK